MGTFTSRWHEDGKPITATFNGIVETPDMESGFPVWQATSPKNATVWLVSSNDDLAKTQWHLEIRQINDKQYGYYYSAAAYKAAMAPKEAPKPAERTAKVKVVVCAPKMKNGQHDTYTPQNGQVLYKFDMRVQDGDNSIVGTTQTKSAEPPYKSGDEIELVIVTNPQGFVSFKKVAAQGGFGGGGKSYSPPNYKALAWPQVMAALINQSGPPTMHDIEEMARMANRAIKLMEV